MIADDLLSAHARPWVAEHAPALAYAIAPLPCLAISWWLVRQPLPATQWVWVIGYSITHLVLLAAQRYAQAQERLTIGGAIGMLRLLIDTLLAFLLVRYAPAFGPAFYPLYLLLSLRVISTYRQTPTAIVIPFLLGPAYVFAKRLGSTPLVDADIVLLAQWGLLFGGLGFGIFAIWASAARQRENELLRLELRHERQVREARVAELEHTTNDIRARMREQHALEEGLRVITSTLSLDEVLGQIVDSTVQMLGPARVHGMALSLLDGETFSHRTFMLSGAADCPWATPLARNVTQHETQLIISDAAQNPDFSEAMARDLRAALSVPLFIGEGRARGALTVVSSTPAAFSSSDARHLTAFAIQAGIAINNAEMHSQLHQQQVLLAAVVRDINDGLVVIDARGEIILANPIGHFLLNSTSATMNTGEQLRALAKSMRMEDMPMLTGELRLDNTELETESVYLAFASQVHQDSGAEPLTAIVLHDITAQKAEERSRTEFISMVSHELRNPLNSINGFIKVVLQGRAGALTALQHEFLEIADGQVEQLKSRIAELLEYNRFEAGRLTLDPQWNDLQLLATATVARLRLQAEQAGITLKNEFSDDVPESFFDSERIGQVMTNLIENGIKATPPGGSITVRSEMHSNEIWVRVADTGIGIPAEEQGKIFQRFYRAHNRASSKGNHLGLGLTICQQIVESHKGRIWVESEEGRGSCFTFALPLIERSVGIS